MEIARADGSVATFWAVHSGLVIQSLALLGSERQRQTWLPRLARLDAIGAFALTEPEHGSDAATLETVARRDQDGYRLDGAKRWIGNAAFADVMVVWARDDEDRVGGYLVERGAPGLREVEIRRKASQRAVPQSDLTFEGVRVPLEARLPGARDFRDVARVLTACRAGIAWAALGHASAAFGIAQAYVGERRQFGRALASFQLVQGRLAAMAAELVSMYLLCHRLAAIEASGRLTEAAASLGKMHNARKARLIVGEARDLLGGNGILLDREVARHQADVEGLFTYEGTDAIHSLVVGRAITGISAFAPR
jgi:glutaryl-CoA dehydrogenase